MRVLAVVIVPFLMSDGSAINPEEIPDCGISCVYDVLKIFRQNVDLKSLQQRFKQVNPSIDMERVSLWELRQTLESFGLYCQARVENSNDAESIPTPSILYFEPRSTESNTALNGHFVVLHRVKDGIATVYDPELRKGVREVPLPALRTVWAGTLLYVSNRDGLGASNHPTWRLLALFLLTTLIVQIALAGRIIWSRGIGRVA